MALVERNRLLAELCPPLDSLLCAQMLDEFISAEQRYIQRDWSPAQLDGGQFCEAVARIWYHADSQNLNLTKPLDDCLKYIEGDQNAHAVVPRQEALHVAKILRTAYKFRSQRGGVHITPTYTANHMDSKLIIECVRWVMMETLRRFWRNDREACAKAVRELLQFDVPAVGVFDSRILVQRTDITAEEEVLILLHYAGEEGYSRARLGEASQFSAPSVSNVLTKLQGREYRQIISLANGNLRLTDLGSRRIRESLASKLILAP